MDKKKITLLGSTGSIGTQTLDVISNYPERFEVEGLVAKSNWQLLSQQAIRFKPQHVVIRDENAYEPLKNALKDYPIKVDCGEKAIEDIAIEPGADMILAAMVGYSGFIPTIKAIEAGKSIALANKETLVVGGEIIMNLVKKHKISLLPVDSEHSAIFQCLQGETHKNMRKIFLTASGGPFRNTPIEKLNTVTSKDALAHPNWNMGAKVTIDSASMMNKGFEMMEAKWLFDCNPDDIEILVHPQSIVHSMVEFCDGSVKAQLGITDMRLPIKYALGYPDRLISDSGFLNISQLSSLTFEKPDFDKFPMLKLAFEAINTGGNMPCLLNAANEIAVAAFLKDQISFISIHKIAEYVMRKATFIKNPDLQDLVESNREALEIAKNRINEISI